MTGFLHYYFGLPYRQTEGLLRTYSSVLPRIPDYTSIQKRINKLKISEKMPKKKKKGKNIVIAIDSTGIKVTNRGDWMSKKWGQRKRFLKLHIGANVDTKEIMAVEITDEHVHDDTKLFKKILEKAKRRGKVTKLLGDAAYDSCKNFSHLKEQGIVAGIKVRVSSVCGKGGGDARDRAVKQQKGANDRWVASVSHGKRRVVESVFSSFKRMFGEVVRSRNKHNMEQELMLKILLYNQFVTS